MAGGLRKRWTATLDSSGCVACCSANVAVSIQLEVGGADDLAPLVVLGGDEGREFGRRLLHRLDAQSGEPRLRGRLIERGVNGRVELLDDVARRFLRGADAVPADRLVTRH